MLATKAQRLLLNAEAQIHVQLRSRRKRDWSLTRVCYQETFVGVMFQSCLSVYLFLCNVLFACFFCLVFLFYAG